MDSVAANRNTALPLGKTQGFFEGAALALDIASFWAAISKQFKSLLYFTLFPEIT